MRSLGLVVIVLAWTALQLPWELCVCNDQLLPALGEEHCHERPCSDDHEDHPADHELVEFVSVRPDSKPALDIASPDSAMRVTGCAAAQATVDRTPPWDRPPAPRDTVVLLL